MIRRPPRSTLFPLHDALPISWKPRPAAGVVAEAEPETPNESHDIGLTKGARSNGDNVQGQDRKSTRLNSSHSQISYAVFCLKKKKTNTSRTPYSIALATSHCL